MILILALGVFHARADLIAWDSAEYTPRQTLNGYAGGGGWGGPWTGNNNVVAGGLQLAGLPSAGNHFTTDGNLYTSFRSLNTEGLLEWTVPGNRFGTWDTAGSGRPIDLTFSNGTQVETPFGALLEDRPNLVLGNNNVNTAYYLGFDYTAQATSLSIRAEIPMGTPQHNSFHMYALTNEVSVAPVPTVITSVTRNGLGEIVISFRGEANTLFAVTKSADLVSPFVALPLPLAPLTDASGVGQAIVPASEASEPAEFYRIEK